MSHLPSLANTWFDNVRTYEPGRPIKEVARELGIPDAENIVKLASNENALGPSPQALAAMQNAAKEMHLYPDGSTFYLKQALSEKLGVSGAELVVTNGSNEAIELLGHLFLGPGKSIVMAERAFLVYKLVAQIFEAETVSVPMNGFTHDLDAMLRAIDERTRIVFIANPNNPTGSMLDEAQLDAFMDAVPDTVVVVFDEAYIELLPQGRQPNTIKYVKEGRNVFLLRTFSKAYALAGLRIGYAMGPEDGIALLQRARQPFNVNAMAQAAALAALSDESHLDQTRAMVSQGLTYLCEQLDALNISYVPSVTNFMLVEVGEGRPVFEALQREKVIVRPMDAYGLPQYVRVTIGTQPENEAFINALSSVIRIPR